MSRAGLPGRRNRPRIDGATILITGASSGIGRAFAALLAPRAARLLLVARRRDRLEALRDQLLAEHPGLLVHIDARDLADADALEACVATVLHDVGAVDILINNAGAGDFALLQHADWARLEQLIRINVLATTQLTHRLLPALRAGGRGGIVMVGSGAGMAWMPGTAVYVGTKHFIDGFSETLRLELHRSGLTVTQVCPGPVATEFDQVAGIDPRQMGPVPVWLRIDAEQCAREAVQGFAAGRALVFPGWRFRALMRLQALTPRSLQRLALRSVMDLPALQHGRNAGDE